MITQKKKCVVDSFPPLPWAKEEKGENFVHPFLIFMLAETRMKNKEKKCSSFGSSLAKSFKEEGRRKVEEVRPCM